MDAALPRLVDLLLDLYIWAILLRVLLSWFRPAVPSRPLEAAHDLLVRLTEPVLAPIRQRLPGHYGPVDFSPMVATLLIVLLKRLLWSLWPAY